MKRRRNSQFHRRRIGSRLYPMLESLFQRIRASRRLIGQLGFFPAALFEVQKLRRRAGLVNGQFLLRSKHARYSLRCRRGASDLDVFRQIFLWREYRCIDDVRSAGLIVDCGANVGYSAAYFLSRFRESRLVAIEPDPSNFAVLQRNLVPYGARAQVMRSAVWSHPARMVFSDVPYGDGREWSRQVRPAKRGETPSIMAVDLAVVLRDSGFDRISILKIDIERAEIELFSARCETWLSKVDTLLIELHDDECRDVFLRAIAFEDFSVSQCGELTVCKRPRATIR